jgi:multicomponent Na+:H+ antiporter subunit E
MPLAEIVFILAIIWILMKGTGSAGDFFVGLILAALILRFLRQSYHRERSFVRFKNVGRYLASFSRELVKANLQVLGIVLAPRIRIRPGILAYRTQCHSPLALTLLANSITLTPGTLSMDISEDNQTIFVHALDITHPDEVREAIRRGLEEPVIGAME